MEVRKIQNISLPEWAFDSPQRIREHAMKDACEAIKNAKIKYKQTGQFQEVHYRSKKDSIQRFGFDKQSLKDTSIFRSKYKVNFFPTEEIEYGLEGTEIVYEDGRWFLIIPRTINVKVPETQRLNIIALDPGVRSFQTYFSEECFGKIGCGDFNKIYRLCSGLDKLQSKYSIADKNARRRLKKASQRLRWKIYDLIDDLHKKTAYFLVSRFDNIVIPSFETSQMVTKLHSKTARNMLTFAHYRFQQFLKMKAEEYSSKVVNISEAYTSKTCSNCGKIHSKLGSKKILKCSCGITMDRDYNGARGILLKTISTKPFALRATSTNGFNKSISAYSSNKV